MATPTQEQTRAEQFKVEGDLPLAETKRLIKEGECPPDQHRAVGAVAALVTDSSIVVERAEPSPAG